MKRIITFLIICICVLQQTFAESIVQNYVYVKRDTCNLSMDVYSPVKVFNAHPCIIYVFGGGFITGSKTKKYIVDYCKALADSGYIVAAIDYRMGMKGQKQVGIMHVKQLHTAIDMAVEDVYSATNFILLRASELNVDPSKIILNGSSAGAITALQADYELSNRTKIASVIPSGFHYAGVISFAGGLLSFDGMPKYNRPPAPTFFFHGTEDHLVLYNKVQFFNKGFFGTNALVEQFEKFNYPYYAYRYRDMGHEIAGIPMRDNLSEIYSFIEDYVINHRQLKKDMIMKDYKLKRIYFGNWRPKDMYK